jgi:hypothetical protein
MTQFRRGKGVLGLGGLGIVVREEASALFTTVGYSQTLLSDI